MSVALVVRYLRGRAKVAHAAGHFDVSQALADEAENVSRGAWRSDQKAIGAAIRAAPPSIVRRPIRVASLEGDARARALARVEATIERDRFLGTAPEAPRTSDRLPCGHPQGAAREDGAAVICGICSQE